MEPRRRRPEREGSPSAAAGLGGRSRRWAPALSSQAAAATASLLPADRHLRARPLQPLGPAPPRRAPATAAVGACASRGGRLQNCGGKRAPNGGGQGGAGDAAALLLLLLLLPRANGRGGRNKPTLPIGCRADWRL